MQDSHPYPTTAGTKKRNEQNRPNHLRLKNSVKRKLRLENSPKGIAGKEDMTVKGNTVDAKDIHLKAGNNIRILSSESKSTTIEDPKVKKE